jgi:hypothetical protein
MKATGAADYHRESYWRERAGLALFGVKRGAERDPTVSQMHRGFAGWLPLCRAHELDRDRIRCAALWPPEHSTGKKWKSG